MSVFPPPVVVESPPGRRRTPWLALAAGVLVAGGIGVYIATKDDGDSGPKYSLTAAAEGAAKATTISYETTMDQGPIGKSTAKGKVDLTNRKVFIDADNDRVGHLVAIYDAESGLIYIEAALLKSAPKVPTRWVSMSIDVIPGFRDLMSESLDRNPISVVTAFSKAKSVEDLGMDTVNGEKVKHYRVTVLTADALAASPALQKMVEGTNIKLPDALVYDVYVTAGNELRRMVYEITVGGITTSADTVYTAIGTDDPVELPDPKDVTDGATLD